MAEPIELEEFRLHLGERIPEDGEETDTLFLDTDLQSIIDRFLGDFLLCMYYGWIAKAGQLAVLIDINESGSDRKLSQRYKHANSQVKLYEKLLEKEADELVATLRASAVGLGFDAFAVEDEEHNISIFAPDSNYEVRFWPLYRFPAIF